MHLQFFLWVGRVKIPDEPSLHPHFSNCHVCVGGEKYWDPFATINSPWWKGPVEAEADVEEVAMVTTAEGRGFPEEVRDLRPPLGPTVWPPPLFFLFFTSVAALTLSAAKASLELLPEWADDTSWKLALVKRAALSSNRFCEDACREETPPPELPLL